MPKATEKDIKGFTFWRSYHDAAQILLSDGGNNETPDYSLYGHFVYNICEYMLYGKDPELIDPVEIALFIACKPNMDNTKEAVLQGINGARKRDEAARLREIKHVKDAEAEEVTPEDIPSEESEETETVNEVVEVSEEEELKEAEEKQKLYLELWNSHAEVFGFYSCIENPRAFKEFFRNKKVTKEYIETGMNNCIQAVKLGYYEQKYINSDPGKFVKQLNKFQKPYVPEDKQNLAESEQNYDFQEAAKMMMEKQ